MTRERKEEIKKEAERRTRLWLANSNWNEMTAGQSYLRFDMALGLLDGFPFDQPKWMKDKNFGEFITLDEYTETDYDDIIASIFKVESAKYESKKSKTKILILILPFLFFITGCDIDTLKNVTRQDIEEIQKKKAPKKYKCVTEIKHETKTYVVTTSTQSGGNEIQRGAGGAIIGGCVDMLLGGSGGGGAIVGGLLGAATTKNPEVESYTETRTDIIYTIVFNDGSVIIKNNILPYAIGDSLEIY